jgi:hypothetical protein
MPAKLEQFCAQHFRYVVGNNITGARVATMQLHLSCNRAAIGCFRTVIARLAHSTHICVCCTWSRVSFMPVSWSHAVGLECQYLASASAKCAGSSTGLLAYRFDLLHGSESGDLGVHFIQ